MGLYLESCTTEVLLVLTGLVTLLYYYFTSTFNYWKDRGVPFIQPTPFIGSSWDLLLARKSRGFIFKEYYEQLKGSKYGGAWTIRSPLLMAFDPDFLKDIMIRDFQYFSDRGIPFNEKMVPLSAHLVNLGGWRWKALRTKLTPTFTSGKVKQMFNIMAECTVGLEKMLDEPAKNNQVVEIKEPLEQFTIDIIGTCAFGLQLNAMNSKDNEFRKMGTSIFQPSYKVLLLRILAIGLPFITRFISISAISSKTCKFFIGVVDEVIHQRKEKNITRNDMMQLLIEIQKQGPIVDEEAKYDTSNYMPTDGQGRQVLELDNKLLAAQVFVFFLAGYETSATTMSFALYELAQNPDIQDKLAEEIQETLAKNGGKLNYDAIQDMKYLDKVVSETLRKFSPIQVITRRVTKPYQVPGADFILPIGMRVLIPVYALHHDPEFYPKPEKFDPERFSPEVKNERHPMVYLPFGGGPRICIGARFGLLQVKLGLTSVLSKFKVEICEETPIPPVFDPTALFTSLKSGVYLRIRQRSELI